VVHRVRGNSFGGWSICVEKGGEGGGSIGRVKGGGGPGNGHIQCSKHEGDTQKRGGFIYATENALWR